MNKRKRKKAFKKKYGLNPPQIPDIIESISRATAALRGFVRTLEERERRMKEKMLGMTEEEFVEFLETSVNEKETKELAMKLRYEEKAEELRRRRENDGV